MRSSGPDRALSETTSNVRDNPSLLTPAQLSRWQGLPLGWVGTPEGAWSSKFSPASTVLSLLDTGALRARINVSGRSRDIDVKANAMALLCANDEVRVDQLDCSRARRILLHLDVATLSRHGLLFDDDLVTASLRQSHEFYDPALAAVLRAMLREIKQGCPNGTLFAESLSVGVALQLCRTRGLHAPPAAAERGKLSPWQWSRLNDLLVSELASDLSLSALSACVNLSKPHFVRLFRNTTGTSPHRYVAQKRVERARQLIQTSNLPLIDIAAEAGFASQSHLGRMFQKRYGLTPGELRKQAAARRTRT